MLLSKGRAGEHQRSSAIVEFAGIGGGDRACQSLVNMVQSKFFSLENSKPLGLKALFSVDTCEERVRMLVSRHFESTLDTLSFCSRFTSSSSTIF